VGSVALGDELVESADGLAQFGVEVVLDAVVSPGWEWEYLPGSFWEMTDHLLPISSCILKSTCSSSRVHSQLMMLESRWLWYLN